jgi:lipoyl(octanoyl) transferase
MMNPPPFGAAVGAAAPQWCVSAQLVPYPAAVAAMEARVAAIRAGAAPELVWLLEHPPLYTAGTSAKAADLLDTGGLPVYRSGRGGQFTYHGPGQRVVYLMLDLNRRRPDLRAYVRALEDWLIAALAAFNVAATAQPAPRIGLWVARPDKGPGVEDKIAAIGVRVRGWVAYHGISLNVEPDLDHYGGIVPCGIRDGGVTSLVDLGRTVGLDEVDAALLASFGCVFGAASPMVGDPPELAGALAATSGRAS